MKFLVLALCVYSASAAVPGYHGYQQPWGAAAQAVAQVGVPVAQAVVQPAVVAKAVLTGNPDADAPILRYDSDVNASGFKYSFETANGISASSTGTLKNVDNTNVLVFQGGYQYNSPEGTPVELTYTADENGYQPRSSILPVAPPVPEAILRSLQYLAEHATQNENNKSY